MYYFSKLSFLLKNIKIMLDIVFFFFAIIIFLIFFKGQSGAFFFELFKHNCTYMFNFFNCFFYFDNFYFLEKSIDTDVSFSSLNYLNNGLLSAFNKVYGPIFCDDILFFFSIHLSIWENYWYYTDPYYMLSFENFYNFDRILLNYNECTINTPLLPSLNSSFFNSIFFKNYFFNNFFLYNSYTVPDIVHGSFFSENLFLRFPRRFVRFSNIDFLSSRFYFFSENLFPKTYSKYTPIFNKIYSSYQLFYLDLSLNKSHLLNKWLFSYFNSLNLQFTKSIVKSNFLSCYYVSAPQINHLLSLNLDQIQFLLKLLEEDPSFSGKSFLDVHWEIYSGFEADRRQLTDDFFFKSFFYLRNVGFHNPFELIFPKYFSSFNLKKFYFFNQRDLCILPFHILLNIGGSPNYEYFFTFDVFSKARSSLFVNLLFNSDLFYAGKIFQYQQYSIYSREAILGILSEIVLKKAPYQHFDVMVQNPWWESLDGISKSKYVLFFKFLSFEDFHLVSIDLIDRYLNGLEFYTFSEISNILSLNNAKIVSEDYYGYFRFLYCIQNFFFSLNNYFSSCNVSDFFFFYNLKLFFKIDFITFDMIEYCFFSSFYVENTNMRFFFFFNEFFFHFLNPFSSDLKFYFYFIFDFILYDIFSYCFFLEQSYLNYSLRFFDFYKFSEVFLYFSYFCKNLDYIFFCHETYIALLYNFFLHHFNVNNF